MKTITQYVCEVCCQVYYNEQDALKCEATPLKDDKGVKVGDIVLITEGDGKGHNAKVTDIKVLPPTYYTDKYHHSIALTADVIDSWGCRFLTCTDYEVIK
jgi:hypothetical protein